MGSLRNSNESVAGPNMARIAIQVLAMGSMAIAAGATIVVIANHGTLHDVDPSTLAMPFVVTKTVSAM